MKKKPKLNWKRQWKQEHRRAFKTAQEWWLQQMPPPGWGAKSPCKTGVKVISAMGAHGDRPIGGVEVELQDHLAPGVEARLTQVMHRLVCNWFDGGLSCATDFQAIRELASADLEQRISTALVKSILEVSQFITCVGILAVHLEQGRLVSEERILSLEQFAIHLRQLTRQLVEVTQLDSGRTDVLGQAQGIDGGTDQ